jgi:hypothetical protein
MTRETGFLPDLLDKRFHHPFRVMLNNKKGGEASLLMKSKVSGIFNRDARNKKPLKMSPVSLALQFHLLI